MMVGIPNELRLSRRCVHGRSDQRVDQYAIPATAYSWDLTPSGELGT